jgi:hypothetical protein
MINESIIMKYLQELVDIGPRLTGTLGCKQAAEYIYQKFEEVGLDTRYQYWESFGNGAHPRMFRSQNVEGTLQGKNKNEEIIIFNAHYDTVRVSPGANDDGSGVAAVLVAAKILSLFEFNRTIRFLAFSGEEIGLLGSRRYVEEIYENETEVLVEFNADMIGYANTSEGARKMSISVTKDAGWMYNEILKVNEIYGINLILSKWSIDPFGQRMGSDFHDFVEYGYESIGWWESEWDRRYWHTPEDTIENMNIDYLINTTKIIVASLAHLADIEMEKPQVKIASPKRGKMYYKDQIVKDFIYEHTLIIDDFEIYADVKPGNAPIAYVEFYYNNKLIFNDTEKPYRYIINKFSMKRQHIKIVAYDEEGKSTTDEMRVFFFNRKYK